jgi:hypothetical protein
VESTWNAWGSVKGSTKQARCLERTDVVSTRNSNAMGLYSPKPSATFTCYPSGTKLDGRLCWKPPDTEEKKRHTFNVVNDKYNEMNAGHSPNAKTVPAPCI